MSAPFKLTEAQERANKILAGPERHVALVGGSRSGKTFLDVRAVVIRALRGHESRHAILRFRENAVWRSIGLDTFPAVMRKCFPGVPVIPRRGDGYFLFPNKAELWLGGLDEKERVERILGQEFCVSPQSRLLTADLRWVRADHVGEGDQLIAFPEDLDGHMKLTRSVVERVKNITARRYRIKTTRGECIVSADHRFVAYYDDRRHDNFRCLSWRRASDLKVGDSIRFACDPWGEGTSWDDGWLSGLYDGEGWVGEAGGCGVAQNGGDVQDRLEALLRQRNIGFNRYVDKTGCIQIRHDVLWDALRAIGIIRPTRLLPKSCAIWEDRRGFTARGAPSNRGTSGELNHEGRHVAVIQEVHDLGDGPVVAIQTSTGTFISDGFLGHNCTIYFNECSQIPYSSVLVALTRLAQTIPGLKQKAYYDLNPLGRGHWTNRLFGEKRDPISLQPLRNPQDYVRMFMNPRDNAANLTREYIESLEALPERQRKRFYEGVYVDEADGQLWSYETIERCRLPHPGDDALKRVVVAVDASGASGSEDLQAAEIGIVVAALGQDGHGYVLADKSCRESPAVWGKIVANAAAEFEADCVVAEKNFGGDMVQFVIKTANPKLLVRMVTASRGKVVRAEPISALYGDSKTSPRVHHVDRFPMLEEQMCGFTTGGYIGEESPDRADAMVWALTELMLKGQTSVRVSPIIVTAPVVPHGTHQGFQ